MVKKEERERFKKKKRQDSKIKQSWLVNDNIVFAFPVIFYSSQQKDEQQTATFGNVVIEKLSWVANVGPLQGFLPSNESTGLAHSS